MVFGAPEARSIHPCASARKLLLVTVKNLLFWECSYMLMALNKVLGISYWSKFILQ